MLFVAVLVMATSGAVSWRERSALPPLPAVVFSSRGMVPVTLYDATHEFELAETDSDSAYMVGEFVTHDTGTRPHRGKLPFIHIGDWQSLEDQWLTLEHERAHLALWAHHVVLPDDLAEKVAEAIAKERVGEMLYRDSQLVIPDRKP